MSKEILRQAYDAWTAAADMRRRRARCKRYTYGDQWSDTVVDADGRAVREEYLLCQSGNRPLINNLIRQLVKTIVGRYRSEKSFADVYELEQVAEAARRNCLRELDSRMLEEFLISGAAVQRVSRDGCRGADELLVENVDFRRFFVNEFYDPRGRDIDLIGMLHDMTFPEMAARFAGGSRTRADMLRGLFTGDAAPAQASLSIGGGTADPEFFRARSSGRCRVIEVWTLDSSTVCRDDEVEFNFRWHCRWLAPDGTLLAEYDSPFAHGSHPFVVKFYPLTDGEVHSFVEDVIDQQKAINRLIVLVDKIMASSAKGVLLFPRDQMVENMSWDEICRRWAQADGVIPISGKGTHLPQQVMTNPNASGACQVLQLQMKLFDDISGVSDSLLGRATGARGADLYESQVKNATIALADIFDTFTSFTDDRNDKLIRTRA